MKNEVDLFLLSTFVALLLILWAFLGRVEDEARLLWRFLTGSRSPA